MAEPDKTEHQEWVRKRAEAVRGAYTAFECLTEFGHGESLVDQVTAVQMSCPFHGPDRKPSARYYPSRGSGGEYLRCYFCKENWDSLNLFMKFKGLKFMDALRDLERRFGIKILRRPEGSPINEPVDKGHADYASEAWKDVPRVLELLEAKLQRLRPRTSLTDYVRFCRVLDRIRWDLDLAQGKQTNAMVEALCKLRSAMDSLPDTELGNDDNALAH